ncbi:MAG: cytochrome c biogenesis protein CcdA [Cyanobacteria bacterium P01_H01_bin.121]
MLESLQTTLYTLQQTADQLVATHLTTITPISVGIVCLAGLLTSLTPCMLSMLPITLSYIGGSEHGDRWQSTQQAIWFSLGLATTLAGLGLIAASLGRIYGQIGWQLSLIVSLIAILMGLNLLNIVPLRLPSVGNQVIVPQNWPLPLRSYGLGLTFGLVASPCSTPVLITLLGWVSTSGNLWLGTALLLAYAIGYVMPLIVAGSFLASVKRLLEVRQWSGWITPLSGAVLISFGVLSLLSRVLVA